MLSRYDALVHSLSKPSSDGNSLEQLDAYRLTTIPARLQSLRETNGDMYLEKVEVERLIRWKLYVPPSGYHFPTQFIFYEHLTRPFVIHSKHGKFRPRLEQLVSSNSVSEIEAISRSAFTLLRGDTTIQTAVLPALDKLTALKGIGPASASLLLSVCDPESIPFFSDEAFRWVMTGVDFGGNAGGKGWDRKIKYNKKEYGEFIKRVRELMQRLGGDVKAVDIERVGWILGRDRVVLQGDMIGGEGSDEAAMVKKDVKMVKRKAAVTNSSAEEAGARRSKRLRS